MHKEVWVILMIAATPAVAGVGEDMQAVSAWEERSTYERRMDRQLAQWREHLREQDEAVLSEAWRDVQGQWHLLLSSPAPEWQRARREFEDTLRSFSGNWLETAED